MKLAFRKDEEIVIIDHTKVRAAFEAKKITEDDIVFNNLVETVGQWRKAWQVPFNRSWMFSQLKSAVL